MKQAGQAAYKKDIKGMLANGQKFLVPVWRISSLTINDQCVLHDVDAAVFPAKTRQILGLTALKKAAPFTFSFDPPQYGLYTAIIGGLVIALTGGSRINVSGPTAAFVVILLPVTQTYGLGGLASDGGGSHFVEKLANIVTALPTLHWADLTVSVCTLLVMILWPRLKLRLPGHLIALIVGARTYSGTGIRTCGDYRVALQLHPERRIAAGHSAPATSPGVAMGVAGGRRSSRWFELRRNRRDCAYRH